MRFSVSGFLPLGVYSVLVQSSHTLGKQTDAFDTEVQARRTLDRIAMALAGSKASSLYNTAEAPDFTPDLNYETYLGIQNGLEVYSDPQCIALTHDAGGEATWFQNRGTANERRVIWSRRCYQTPARRCALVSPARPASANPPPSTRSACS